MTGRSPVYVVGAGPVGLTAALVLARRHVPVRVLERHDALSQISRASTFHPSTLDMLEELGVREDLERIGRRVDEIHWRRADGRLLAAIPYGVLAGWTDHPYRLHVEQYHLTRLLLDRLRAHHDATVEFGTEVEAVADSERDASLTITCESRREAVRASWVLAADGAGSTVRASSGLAFDEAPYPSYALRVMTRTPLDRLVPGTAPLTYLRDPSGSASLLALPDHWRLIFRIDSGVDPVQAVTPEHVAGLIAATCPFDAADLEIVDAHTYRLARGVAEAYRRGRVLLAGDAAHITSTAGGLNMNCGVHDAVEIASVLADVWHGRCGPEALDSSAARRRAVVTERVIPHSEGRVRGVADGDTRALHRAITDITEIAARRDRSREYLVNASMLDTAPTLAIG